MKKINILLALAGCFALSKLHASTTLYFSNNSKLHLKAETTYTGGKIDEDGFIRESDELPKKLKNPNVPMDIDPGDQNIELVTFSRGEDLEVDKTYIFDTKIGPLPGGYLHLLQKVHCTYIAYGPLKKSTIAVKAYGEGFDLDTKWYTEKDFHKLFTLLKSIGGLEFELNFAWKYTGEYDDLYFGLEYEGAITEPWKLNLWQHNIQERPSTEGLSDELASFFGADEPTGERAQLSAVALPEAIHQFDKNIDVITVNEAFTNSLIPKLKNQFASHGYVHATEVLGKDRKLGQFWPGGVMVFSKHPIAIDKDYIFKSHSSLDANAAKGVKYVKIIKKALGQPDQPYHIFATHTNASYEFPKAVGSRLSMTDEGRIARRGQFDEMRTFIKKQRIPKNEPVIMVGDMNVDMISEKGKSGDEYADMLKRLNAVHPQVAGYTYTLDRTTNEWVNPDDGPPQYLDYGLYSKDHLKPTEATNTPICLKQYGHNICRKGGTKGTPHDVSDHYPVQVKMTFPKQATGVKRKRR